MTAIIHWSFYINKNHYSSLPPLTLPTHHPILAPILWPPLFIAKFIRNYEYLCLQCFTVHRILNTLQSCFCPHQMKGFFWKFPNHQFTNLDSGYRGQIVVGFHISIWKWGTRDSNGLVSWKGWTKRREKRRNEV